MGQVVHQALWFAQDLLEHHGSFPLRVIASHVRVASIAVEGWAHLLLVSCPAVCRGPATIGLSSPGFAEFREFVARNPAGRLGPGYLVLAGESETFLIRWDGSPAVSFAPPDSSPRGLVKVSAILPVLRRWLLNAGVSSPSAALLGVACGDDYFVQRICAHFPPLVSSMLSRKKRDVMRHCRELIGLGRGASPTGDDLLHGAFVAYHHLLGAGGGSGAAPRLPADFAARTTRLGAHMLEMGREGLTPEPAREFLLSCLDGDLPVRLLEELCSIGSSTGYDIAVGMYCVLAGYARREGCPDVEVMDGS